MIRLFDILFSFLGLIVLSPILIIIAIWVKLSSKGPFFYKQTRIGKKGIPFSMIKFRSMFVDADKKGLLLTVGGRDPRITNVGYILRKYKLDELPQLWNVLIGNMSIVGPRPEVKKYVDLYTEEQKIVLSIKPGITDLASVTYQDENTLLEKQKDPERYYINTILPNKIRLNKIYIQKISIKLYFQIIFLTIKRVFKK